MLAGVQSVGMNYTTLIAEAWATTWRYRFLWVLGLLAGATGGTMGLGRTSLPELPSAADSFAFLTQSWTVTALLVLAAAGLAAVAVLARGGITQATIDLQSGGSTSLFQAWRAGGRWFWRFLGLLVLLGLLVTAVLGAVIGATASLGAVGAVLGALILTLGVAASIVLAYAERAIVVHDLRATEALSHAWRLFTEHLSTSLLTWVLSLALALAIGGIAGSVWVLFAGAAAVVAVVMLAAIANAFFWNLWTLVYLRLDPPITA